MNNKECNKVQYTKKEAETELNAFKKGKTLYLLGRKRRKMGHKPVRIYHCPIHNCWHLTSKIEHMLQEKVSRYSQYPKIEDKATLNEYINKYDIILYATNNCFRCDILYDSLIAKGWTNIVKVKTTDDTLYPAFPKLKSMPIIFYKGYELISRRSTDIINEINSLNKKKERENVNYNNKE